MENPLTNLNPLALMLSSSVITEEGINQLAETVTEDILENSNGITELVLMNALKKFCEGVDERLRKRVDIRDSYDSVKGVKITKGNTGQKLNYEDDAEYSKIELLRKERMKILSMAQKNMSNTEITDTKSGEVIPIVSIKTPAKEIIKLEFPKS